MPPPEASANHSLLEDEDSPLEDEDEDSPLEEDDSSLEEEDSPLEDKDSSLEDEDSSLEEDDSSLEEDEDSSLLSELALLLLSPGADDDEDSPTPGEGLARMARDSPADAAGNRT